jgi:hypothetical protein
VIVNGENWGNIKEWKYKYDTAIEKLIEAWLQEELQL